ncbi:hypothetical protein D3C72_1107810 [compost metagenome]
MRNNNKPAKNGNIIRTTPIQKLSKPQPVATSPREVATAVRTAPLMITTIHNPTLFKRLPINAYRIFAMYSWSSDQQGPFNEWVSPHPRTSGEGINVKLNNIIPINLIIPILSNPSLYGFNQTPNAPMTTLKITSGCKRINLILKKSFTVIRPQRSS